MRSAVLPTPGGPCRNSGTCRPDGCGTPGARLTPSRLGGKPRKRACACARVNGLHPCVCVSARTRARLCCSGSAERTTFINARRTSSSAVRDHHRLRRAFSISVRCASVGDSCAAGSSSRSSAVAAIGLSVEGPAGCKPISAKTRWLRSTFSRRMFSYAVEARSMIGIETAKLSCLWSPRQPWGLF